MIDYTQELAGLFNFLTPRRTVKDRAEYGYSTSYTARGEKKSLNRARTQFNSFTDNRAAGAITKATLFI